VKPPSRITYGPEENFDTMVNTTANNDGVVCCFDWIADSALRRCCTHWMVERNFSIFFEGFGMDGRIGENSLSVGIRQKNQ